MGHNVLDGEGTPLRVRGARRHAGYVRTAPGRIPRAAYHSLAVLLTADERRQTQMKSVRDETGRRMQPHTRRYAVDCPARDVACLLHVSSAFICVHLRLH